MRSYDRYEGRHPELCGVPPACVPPPENPFVPDERIMRWFGR
ncbi:hypothetical protein [Streptomyces sp. NPDC047123]